MTERHQFAAGPEFIAGFLPQLPQSHRFDCGHIICRRIVDLSCRHLPNRGPDRDPFLPAGKVWRSANGGATWALVSTAPHTACPSARPGANVRPARTDDVDLGGASMSVVDDEPINRVLVARLLQGCNCETTLAASRQAALATGARAAIPNCGHAP